MAAPLNVGIESEVTREIADPAPDLQAVRAAVQPEERRRSGCGLDQVQQQPHRRRLPRPVRAEKTQNLAAPDLQMEPEEPVPLAVVLRQTRGPDRDVPGHERSRTLS
jgi:hypothetical protein